jgi:hypothetical protein
MHQWKKIQSPDRVWLSFLEGEEEGEGSMAEIFDVPKLLDFIISNKGKSNINFQTKDFYKITFDLNTFTKLYIPVKIGNEKISVFVNFTANSGLLDFSLNIDNLYNHIGMGIDLKDHYHTGFYINFQSNNKINLIELWTKTYDEYEILLKYLGFTISNEQGISYFKSQYDAAIRAANNDCNKFDVIFETIPHFVLEDLNNDDSWTYLTSLLSCSKSGWGTDEYKAIINILNGFSSDYLYTKIIANKTLFRNLVSEIPERLLPECIEIFASVGASKWTDQEINNSGHSFAQPVQEMGSTEQVQLQYSVDGNNEDYFIYCGLYKEASVSDFTLGYGYSTFADRNPISLRQIVVETKDYAYFSPITLSFQEGYDITIPAFFAYEIITRYAPSSLPIQMLQLSTSVLLPELTLAKLRSLGKIFKIRGSTTITIVDNTLLTELNALTTGTNGTMKPFVQANLQRLVNNTESIWAMPSAVKRGQIFEEIFAHSEYSVAKGWQNIGQLRGGSQPLGDFFHNNGMFVQVKTTNVTNPGSISSNISTYKQVIDKLADVKASGTFTTATGQQLQITAARLDIVVPKGYDVSVFKAALESYNSQIPVNFIIK